MKSFSQLQDETRVVQFGFLVADLRTGNTFLDVAQTTRNPETRTRNVHNASVAYDAVLRLGQRANLTASQTAEVEEKLQALKQRLIGFERSPGE